MTDEDQIRLRALLITLGNAVDAGNLKSLALVAHDGENYMWFVSTDDSIKLIGETYILLRKIENYHNEKE